MTLSALSRRRLAPQRTLQRFVYNETVYQGLASQQAGLSRPIRPVKGSPQVHGRWQGEEGNRAGVRDLVAERYSVPVGMLALHVLLVTGNQDPSCGSERSKPGEITKLEMKRCCPNALLIAGQVQKNFLDRGTMMTGVLLRLRGRLWLWISGTTNPGAWLVVSRIVRLFA